MTMPASPGWTNCACAPCAVAARTPTIVAIDKQVRFMALDPTPMGARICAPESHNCHFSYFLVMAVSGVQGMPQGTCAPPAAHALLGCAHASATGTGSLVRHSNADCSRRPAGIGTARRVHLACESR